MEQPLDTEEWYVRRKTTIYTQSITTDLKRGVGRGGATTLQNDVSNQQDATNFSFINLLNQPYMFRATNSPILKSTF